MKYGINMINFSHFSNPVLLAEIAAEAEDAGWDGIFIWDHITLTFTDAPVIDPWIALTAMAANTSKIKLGPMVTPVPRRRPWKLARETVSLDHVSNGRLMLGVGLGVNECFHLFGENINLKVRAEKLDEGLEILLRLWSGEAFSFTGKHYNVKDVKFLPKPVQNPRIPIIVGGGYPGKLPFKRAARFDGVFPINTNYPNLLTPDNLEDILTVIEKDRGNLDNYTVMVNGETVDESEKEARKVKAFIKAGANWWLEDLSGLRGSVEENMKRVKAGPPKI
jgi:alkanesulfonate monooxygenase SsuD/methylene tetrahydromethanopterin reductase-like flavin-dependent oxidoreductase (luciferase family)